MTAHVRQPAWAVAAILLAASVSLAGDTIRLVDRPAHRADTRRLDLRPADREADDTQRTCLFGGGFGIGYYGGFGFYGPSVSLFSYWDVPAFYYPAPVFSYYVPPPVFYAPPVVYFEPPIFGICDSLYPPGVPADESDGKPARRSESRSPDDNGTFPYDGDPKDLAPQKRIPPAKNGDPPRAPELPAPPDVPKLGPSPMAERMVSLPPAPARKKYTYRAYGEGRDETEPVPRDTKDLLIRGRR